MFSRNTQKLEMLRLCGESGAAEYSSALSEFEFQNPTSGEVLLAERRTRGYFASSPLVADSGVIENRSEVETQEATVLRPKGFGTTIVATTPVTTEGTTQGKAILGLVNWTELEVYLGGKRQIIALVSGLRVANGWRSGRVFLKGYRELKGVARSSSAKEVVSFVLRENTRVLKMLLPERRRQLSSSAVGSFETLLIKPERVVSRFKKRRGGQTGSGKVSGIRVRRASTEDAEALAEFLNREGRKRALFPAVTVENLLNRESGFRGLAIEDFVVADTCDGSGNDIAGCLGVWDQSSYRNWVVTGYRFMPDGLRRLYNLYARVLGRITLPRIGESFGYKYLAMICIKGDRAGIATDLLRAISEGELKGTKSVLAIGFHERDPLLAELRPQASRVLKSEMIRMEIGEPSSSRSVSSFGFAGDIPHFELGLL